jgi:hypothetical protein
MSTFGLRLAKNAARGTGVDPSGACSHSWRRLEDFRNPIDLAKQLASKM